MSASLPGLPGRIPWLGLRFGPRLVFCVATAQRRKSPGRHSWLRCECVPIHGNIGLDTALALVPLHIGNKLVYLTFFGAEA